ncbi:uncharacterized protein LOC130991314 isoform X4 [Salvia miltiorrhiza]|uniref:uncharacterized protein LOC130991314 isoform X4 n=1 Tax=Salvia miltiorrhiza TaxID=226208 RepID=UPI0025ACC281|nr:uncharacterized protein LOC130991314 isoform X4 [Salvia miltiorrhiza]
MNFRTSILVPSLLKPAVTLLLNKGKLLHLLMLLVLTRQKRSWKRLCRSKKKAATMEMRNKISGDDGDSLLYISEIRLYRALYR